MSKWCWAATAQMIMSYWGDYQPQCRMVNVLTYGYQSMCAGPGCSGGYDCNWGGDPGNLFGFYGYHFSMTPQWNALSFAQIQNEVSWGRPWAHLVYYVGGNTHWEVGTDWYHWAGTNWVVINDPEPEGQGSQYAETYSDYVSETYMTCTKIDYYNIWPNYL
jgi:hypothetical protein